MTSWQRNNINEHFKTIERHSISFSDESVSTSCLSPNMSACSATSVELYQTNLRSSNTIVIMIEAANANDGSSSSSIEQDPSPPIASLTMNPHAQSDSTTSLELVSTSSSLSSSYGQHYQGKEAEILDKNKTILMTHIERVNNNLYSLKSASVRDQFSTISSQQQLPMLRDSVQTSTCCGKELYNFTLQDFFPRCATRNDNKKIITSSQQQQLIAQQQEQFCYPQSVTRVPLLAKFVADDNGIEVNEEMALRQDYTLERV